MIRIVIGATLLLIGLGLYFGLHRYFKGIDNESVKRKVKDHALKQATDDYNKVLEKYIKKEK